MSSKLVLVGDFETTVYDGQTSTEVWASALVPLYSEDVVILHSIDETYKYLLGLKQSVIVYYHNLKFDGQFWLSFLISKLHFKQACTTSDDGKQVMWNDITKMPINSFRYMISDFGQFYSITIRTRCGTIELRDSLKLLPFSVKKIGDSFGTKHKKLDMEYKGYRYAGCEITEEEQKYIANDVLVVKEALEIMYDEGHKKLTIGSCCLAEYQKIFGIDEYKALLPDLYEQKIDKETFGSDSAGEYIRKSYRGGWCYVVPEKTNQVKYNGTTADVNSLYPSMMSSESGNRYPMGHATFWKGNYIDEHALYPINYYFVRIKTRFYIKPNHLPFVQIKNSLLYKSTESLKSSDVFDKLTGKYYDHYYWFGELRDTRVTMTMTMTDFELFKEHYDLVDFEILDGCYFGSEVGIFDGYIDKYKKIKMESKGAKRELAKLFLNNLYGKMATSKNSSFKVAVENEDGSIGFDTIYENNKKAGYIAIGSAITSYARNFTIRSAQQNYDHFIYADTDSIHCDCPPNEITGIKVHPKNFCCWKLESCWDKAIFVRQKTYIEHITHEDEQPIDNPYYNVKCAGMSQKCKDVFIKDMLDGNKDLTDFKIGLKINGKLLPKLITGGVTLAETTYEMR